MSGTIAGRLAFDGTRVRIEDLTAETRPGRLVVSGWADVIGERPAVSATRHRDGRISPRPLALRASMRAASPVVSTAPSTIAGGLTAPAITLADQRVRDAVYPPLGSVRLNGRGSFSRDCAAPSRPSTWTRPPARFTPTERLSWAWRRRLPLRRQAISPCAGRMFASMISPALRGVLWRFRLGSLATGSATVDFDAGGPTLSRLRTEATTRLQPAANTPGSDSLALSGTADLQLDRGTWSLGHSIRTSRARASAEGRLTGRLLEGSDQLRSTLGGRSSSRDRNRKCRLASP